MDHIYKLPFNVEILSLEEVKKFYSDNKKDYTIKVPFNQFADWWDENNLKHDLENRVILGLDYTSTKDHDLKHLCKSDELFSYWYVAVEFVTNKFFNLDPTNEFYEQLMERHQRIIVCNQDVYKMANFIREKGIDSDYYNHMIKDLLKDFYDEYDADYGMSHFNYKYPITLIEPYDTDYGHPDFGGLTIEINEEPNEPLFNLFEKISELTGLKYIIHNPIIPDLRRYVLCGQIQHHNKTTYIVYFAKDEKDLPKDISTQLTDREKTELIYRHLYEVASLI